MLTESEIVHLLGLNFEDVASRKEPDKDDQFEVYFFHLDQDHMAVLSTDPEMTIKGFNPINKDHPVYKELVNILSVNKTGWHVVAFEEVEEN